MGEHRFSRYPGAYRKAIYYESSAGLRRCLFLSVLTAAIGSLQILLIPLSNIGGNVRERAFAYLIAGVFWASVIAQIALIFLTRSARAALQDSGFRVKGIQKEPVGVISFFKNTEAAVSDAVLFASTAGIAVILWCRVTSRWLITGCLTILFLSFCLHCIFNGRNYRYHLSLK